MTMLILALIFLLILSIEGLSQHRYNFYTNSLEYAERQDTLRYNSHQTLSTLAQEIHYTTTQRTIGMNT